MDKIKKSFKPIPQACINCIYCRNLNLFRREIVSIGPNKNIISRLGIEESSTSFNHSLCCILFQEEDISAPIYETSPNDFCEKFKFKHIIDKDESSMYDSNMIEMELKPSSHSYEEFLKIAESRIKKD